MGYLAMWKVLEEMVADFRKRGIIIPAEVMNDLKSAKTLINVLRADPSCVDTSQKIEEYLLKVESYLVSEGQKKFGTGYVDGWLKRLDEAGRKSEEETEETRFIPGLPKEQKWIRIKSSAELPVKKLKALAQKLNLLCELQSDGYLLVYGEDKCLKEFVKKMATKHVSQTEK
jgi:hypothetical protein